MRTLVVGIGLMLVTLSHPSSAQDPPGTHVHPPGTPPHEHPAGPIHTTMEALHEHGGVPPGWQFAFPAGDPQAGRAVFVKLACFTCHTIRGEAVSTTPAPPGAAGPDLTGMGSHHPVDYLAESILNPNAVIVEGPGYTGPDGLSIMPDYRDSLTVAELIDLVAYVKSLTDGHGVMVPSPPSGAPTPSGLPGHSPSPSSGAADNPAAAHP